MKIVYLDQNGLSELALEQNNQLLRDFKKMFNEKHYALAIGFPHVYETVKASEKKREKLCSAVSEINTIQTLHLGKIIDAETNNEFYRFLKLQKRESLNSFGPIFLNIKDGSFRASVSFAAMNTEQGKYIYKIMLKSDSTIFDIPIPLF